jgi:hypothetical protein
MSIRTVPNTAVVISSAILSQFIAGFIGMLFLYDKWQWLKAKYAFDH